MKVPALAVGMSLALVLPAAYAGNPAANDWTGIYAGIQAGKGWGEGNNNIGGASQFTEDLDGYMGGVHVGWNTKMQNVVLGIEADVEASNMDADISAGGDTVNLDIGVLGSLRAKAGIGFGNTLVYATGGLAWADIDYEISNGVSVEKFNKNPTGYVVGAGVEIAISKTMSGRLEYRYTDLGSKTYSSALFPTNTFESDLEFHTVRAGLSWYF